MKLIYIILFSLMLTTGYAQQVEGELLINNGSQIKVELKEANAVELFKQFKTGTYQIQFNFKGNGNRMDERKRQVVLFEFVTHIYKNGKLLETVKRKPMPFFPGEMLEPVEAFDIIPLLTYVQGNPRKALYPGKLSSGEYKIVIQAIPIGVKGKVSEASIVVFI